MVASLQAGECRSGEFGRVGECAVKRTGCGAPGKGGPDVLNEADIHPVLARGAQL
jgi:hypothetical protein